MDIFTPFRLSHSSLSYTRVRDDETRATEADARVDTMDGTNPIDDRGARVDEGRHTSTGDRGEDGDDRVGEM